MKETETQLEVKPLITAEFFFGSNLQLFTSMEEAL